MADEKVKMEQKYMNDKVYIKIKGLALEEQAADGSIMEEADNIEVINVGRYTSRGGKEYVKFEEVYDGASQKSISIIKISDDSVEVSKKGAITTCMEFVKNKKTISCYNTPYGSINISIFTSVFEIKRSEDAILIALEYTMEVNDQQMNTNRVEIEITNEKVEL